MRTKIGSKPFSYWKKEFNSCKVWFTRMRVPMQIHNWSQAHENNVFGIALDQYDNKINVINTPVEIINGEGKILFTIL